MSDSINDLEFKKFISLGNGRIGIPLVTFAKAIDGANVGEYVEIQAKWNDTTGAYELLTAGSGTSTPATYSYLLLEDGGYLLQESGDKIIL